MASVLTDGDLLGLAAGIFHSAYLKSIKTEGGKQRLLMGHSITVIDSMKKPPSDQHRRDRILPFQAFRDLTCLVFSVRHHQYGKMGFKDV